MSSPGPAPSYQFEVINASGDVHLYEISEPLCSLGTSEDEADILIDDPSLRPVHIILSFDGFRVRCRPVGGDIRIGATVMPALTPFLLQNDLRIDFGYSSLVLKQVVSGEDEVENLKTPPRGIRVAEIAAILGDPAPPDEPPPRASPPPARSSTLSYRVVDLAPAAASDAAPDADPDDADWERLDRDPAPITSPMTPAVAGPPEAKSPEPEPASPEPEPASPEPEPASPEPEPPEGEPAPPEPEPTVAPPDPVIPEPAPTILLPIPTPVEAPIEAPAAPVPPHEPAPVPTSSATPETPPPAPQAPPAPTPPALTPPAVAAPRHHVDAPTAPGAVAVSTGAVPWEYALVEVLFATASTAIGDDFDPNAPESPLRKAEAELRRQAYALGCHGVAFTRFEQRITPGSGPYGTRPVLDVFAYGTAVRRLR